MKRKLNIPNRGQKRKEEDMKRDTYLEEDTFLNVIITPDGLDRVQIYGKNKNKGIQILKLIEKRLKSIGNVIRRARIDE